MNKIEKMSKQEYWFSLMREHEQSGQTITGFCASRGIKPCTFHYWRKRYRQSQSHPRGFVELTPQPAAGRSLRLAYPNGVCIDLPVADIPLIAQLLRLG